MAEDIDSVDDLYGLVPSEFVAARDALARRVRTAGDRATAGEIAKLRRPSASAWALNKAAREHPALLRAALDAGARLREATASAVGGDVADLREASAAERASSDRFLHEAEVNLGAAASAARSRLAGTLRAAMVDDGVADELRRGVLAADREASGFDFAEDFQLAAPGPPKARRQPSEGRSARQRQRALAAEVAGLEREAARLARAADEAEAAAGQARAAADAAQQELARARDRLDAAG